MRKKAILLPLLLVLAAPACGGDPVSTPPGDLAGRWEGSITLTSDGAPYVFDLRLTQDGREVGGTGRIRLVVDDAPRDSVDVSIEGRYRNPELVFTLASEGFAPLRFDGRIFRNSLQVPDSLVGTLDGSGFTGRRLVLEPVR